MYIRSFRQDARLPQEPGGLPFLFVLLPYMAEDQLFPRPRHPHIEEPSFFLQHFRKGRFFIGNGSFIYVQDIYLVVFQSLRPVKSGDPDAFPVLLLFLSFLLKLFGEKTAGEGMLPELFPLDNGGAVMLAAAKIYPYLSEPYEGVGVEPDVTVPMVDTAKNKIPAETFDDDPQFAAAYAFFTAK